jgi:hypothetical protein
MMTTPTPTLAYPLERATVAVVAYLRRIPARQPGISVRGRPVHLLCTGATVVPLEQHGRRWVCLLLASSDAGPTPEPPPIITVDEVEIETSLPAVLCPLGDIDDATFGELWQARVRQLSTDVLVHRLAALLVAELPPGGRTVTLDAHIVHRLLLGMGFLRPPGLRRALYRLAGHGLIEYHPAAERARGWGSARLVTP